MDARHVIRRMPRVQIDVNERAKEHDAKEKAAKETVAAGTETVHEKVEGIQVVAEVAKGD